jgi:hypothetical protein
MPPKSAPQCRKIFPLEIERGSWRERGRRVAAVDFSLVFQGQGQDMSYVQHVA